MKPNHTPRAPMSEYWQVWFLTVVLWGALFSYGFYYAGTQKVLLEIGADCGLSEQQKGDLVGVVFIGFVFGAALCWLFTDRLGKRLVLSAGLLLFAIGLFVLSAAPTGVLATPARMIFIAMAIIGLGAAMLNSTCSAMLADLHPARRVFIVNLSQALFGLGAMIGPMVSAWVMMTQSWTLFFVINAGMTLALLGALTITPTPRQTITCVARFSDIYWLLKQPVFYAFALGIFAYIGVETGILFCLSDYSRAYPEYSFTQARVGGLITSFWVVMTIGRAAYGWLVERFGVQRMLNISAGAAIASIIGIMLARNNTQLFGAVLCAGVFLSGMCGTILGTGINRFPMFSGTMSGFLHLAAGFGGAAGTAGVFRLAHVGGVGLRGALVLPIAGMLIVWVLNLCGIFRTEDGGATKHHSPACLLPSTPAE